MTICLRKLPELKFPKNILRHGKSYRIRAKIQEKNYAITRSRRVDNFCASGFENSPRQLEYMISNLMEKVTLFVTFVSLGNTL